MGSASAWRPRKRSASKGPPPPRSTSETRARLSLVLLLYFIAMVALVTLAPFQFFVPAFFDVDIVAGWQQTISSALMFVPLGFLYPLTRPGRDTSVCSTAR